MKIDFSDYITITENDILEITQEGIEYTGGYMAAVENVLLSVTLQVLIHPLGFILLH